MKQFLSNFFTAVKTHRAVLLKLLLALAFFVGLSLVSFALLTAFDVIYFDDGVKLDRELFDSFSTAWYGWIVFVLIQTGLSIALCVIPGVAMGFILFSKVIYPVAWQAFLFSVVCVTISSSIMYVIGRYGGYRICEKILGKEDCEKSLSLLRDKGTVFFPIMMMFPVFPDDALVMIAGTLKMKLKWFIPSIIIGRGIGIATIVFGISLTKYLTTPWLKVLFVAGIVLFVFLVFYFANKFSKYLARKKEARIEAAVEETADNI